MAEMIFSCARKSDALQTVSYTKVTRPETKHTRQAWNFRCISGA